MVQGDQIQAFIAAALAEDVGNGDHTSLACIPANSISHAKLLVKDMGVIAGVELAGHIIRAVDPAAEMKIHIRDGQDVDFGDVAFEVSGNTRALLMAERLILNCMQRMSGIATLSNRFAVEVEGSGVTILDTRKTTPLIRFLEKWAVRIGGCTNYREGLYDWVMIKDNHVEACGGVAPAIHSVHEYLKTNSLDLDITVEVRNLVELHEVLSVGGVRRIMFDNFELPILQEAVSTVRGQYETEASGGVTLHTVGAIARTGVQFISVGALTHSAGTLDLSFKMR